VYLSRVAPSAGEQSAESGFDLVLNGGDLIPERVPPDFLTDIVVKQFQVTGSGDIFRRHVVRHHRQKSGSDRFVILDTRRHLSFKMPINELFGLRLDSSLDILLAGKTDLVLHGFLDQIRYG